MNEVLLNTKLNNLNSYLLDDEKDRADSTIKKYKSIARDFLIWTYDTKGITLKDMSRTYVKDYRTELMRHYENYRTLNNRISIVNVYLKSANLNNCTVGTLDYEEDMCKPEGRYLTKDEYERLISCDNEEFEDEVLMALIYGSTAIRVSELQYFTVEAVGTNRVDPHKVFPHGFRHLFAHEHYNKNHDIEALARILGHKSTKTTEIYIRKTSIIILLHRKQFLWLSIYLTIDTFNQIILFYSANKILSKHIKIFDFSLTKITILM